MSGFCLRKDTIFIIIPLLCSLCYDYLSVFQFIGVSVFCFVFFAALFIAKFAAGCFYFIFYMSTKLFEGIVFGPVKSRRLGVSLGVNLLPSEGKLCSFDCIYCECGYNAEHNTDRRMPARCDVRAALERRLSSMKSGGEPLDVITFAGNGEPTLNPDFGGVIEDTLSLRDIYFPDVKVSVLSNATRVWDDSVFEALCRVDNNILKLDTAVDATFRALNVPSNPDLTVARQIEGLARFGGRFILQTMFVRGMHNSRVIDNTTDGEVAALRDAVAFLKPSGVMVYSIARDTPESALSKVQRPELERIADVLRGTGVPVSVY